MTTADEQAPQLQAVSTAAAGLEAELAQQVPVLSMAQAEPMDCRLDLGRSAEKGCIVRLVGSFKLEGIFKCGADTCNKKCRRSFSQPLL